MLDEPYYQALEPYINPFEPYIITGSEGGFIVVCLLQLQVAGKFEVRGWKLEVRSGKNEKHGLYQSLSRFFIGNGLKDEVGIWSLALGICGVGGQWSVVGTLLRWARSVVGLGCGVCIELDRK
ncbi:MAG TPA: hypothetical protein VKX40_08385, partial [Aequorivita sp.]|nr:hypothetical protein [Aequorivita sp.]